MLRLVEIHLSSPVCACVPGARKLAIHIRTEGTTVTFIVRCTTCTAYSSWPMSDAKVRYDRDSAVSTREQLEQEATVRRECHDRDTARLVEIDAALEKLKAVPKEKL